MLTRLGKRGGAGSWQRLMWVLTLPIVLLVAYSAFGQPKGKAKAKEDAKAKDAKAEDDKAKKGKDAKEEEATPSDAGAPPAAPEDDDEPPPRPQTGDGGKLSPLNPEPDEFPQGSESVTPPNYDQLLGDIASLRSRVSALTTTLYASKIRVIVETDGDDARIETFVVTLDGGVVYRAPKRFSAEDEKLIYEHGVAPGHHVLGVEIERSDARGKAYKTYQSSRFSIVVPEKKQLETHFVIEDDSDMAEDFPDDEDGEYDLRVRLRARVIE
ncbi:MAG: hypothetical protein KC766_15105 [Myxococcales bacterium]|nr:hypothetical protein [Myxococcales bacterium]